MIDETQRCSIGGIGLKSTPRHRYRVGAGDRERKDRGRRRVWIDPEATQIAAGVGLGDEPIPGETERLAGIVGRQPVKGVSIEIRDRRRKQALWREGDGRGSRSESSSDNPESVRAAGKCGIERRRTGVRWGGEEKKAVSGNAQMLACGCIDSGSGYLSSGAGIQVGAEDPKGGRRGRKCRGLSEKRALADSITLSAKLRRSDQQGGNCQKVE